MKFRDTRTEGDPQFLDTVSDQLFIDDLPDPFSNNNRILQ